MGGGVVYVLKNPYFPGFVKVGMSTRCAADRAAEINSYTGIPSAYSVFYERKVDDPYFYETLAKRSLLAFQVPGKEIYNVPAEYAAAVIDSVVDGVTVIDEPPAPLRPVAAQAQPANDNAPVSAPIADLFSFHEAA